MPNQEKHKFLTNSVLVTVVCGVILAYVGSVILKSSNKKLGSDYNITTCDKSLLSDQDKESQEGKNGYIIAFTGNVITALGVLFLLLLSALFVPNKALGSLSTLDIIKNIFVIFYLLLFL